MTKIINKTKPIDENKLKEFEEKWSLSLPIDYRNFLLKYNGGKPIPNGFDIKPINDGSMIDNFLGLSKEYYISLEKCLSVFKHRIPDDLLPIARDPGGNLVCLCIRGNNLGKIYFWDHEYESDTNVPYYENVHLISNNFSDFLDELYEVTLDFTQ